jgi:hypothetical protein
MCSIFVESIFSATTSLGNSCSYRSFSLESLVLDVILTILVLSINFLRLLVFFYITCFGFSIDIIISIRGQDLSCPPHTRLLLLVNVESLSGLQSRLTCFRIPCIAIIRIYYVFTIKLNWRSRKACTTSIFLCLEI